MPETTCPLCAERLPEPTRVCKNCKYLVNATATCASCGDLVPPAAKKCMHCQSYQDWRRRWFSESTPMLASLTALVSVIALTINTISTIVAPRSNTTAAIIGSTSEHLLVAVVNSGNAASVTRTFSIKADHDVVTFGDLWTLKEDDTKRFLKSRDSNVLHLFIGSVSRNPTTTNPAFWRVYGATPIHLKGIAIESDGSRRELHDDATLADIRELVEDECANCKDAAP